MLNLFQHPSCLHAGPARAEKWTLKRVQGDDEEECAELRNGFSLVELMVVIFIIGLLATVVLINVLPSQDKAMRVKALGDIATLGQAMMKITTISSTSEKPLGCAPHSPSSSP